MSTVQAFPQTAPLDDVSAQRCEIGASLTGLHHHYVRV
jgi:hypothetical protein